MKYATYFIFIAFIAVTIFFLKNALQPEAVPVTIIGSVKCGECHSLQLNGNQQAIWEYSKHSQAYKTLLTDKSTSFTSKNGLEQPQTNKLCLRCHTTQYFLEDKPVRSSYKIEEGVGCEACHGAGSKYSPDEIMKSWQLFREYGGSHGDEPTCIKCHSIKGNKEQKLTENICPFQTNDFVYKTDFEKIKHPVNRDNFK